MKTVRDSILDFIDYLRTTKRGYLGKTRKLEDTDKFPKDIRFIYPSFILLKDPFEKKYPKETLDILSSILYNIRVDMSVKAFEESIKNSKNLSDYWEVSENVYKYSKIYKIVKRKKDTSFYKKLKEIK